MIGFKLFVQVLCSHSLKCQVKIGKHHVKEEAVSSTLTMKKQPIRLVFLVLKKDLK